MLMTYLKNGRTVDFSINSSAGTSFPKLEMLVSGVNAAPSWSLHLTLMEALELADSLKQMVDHINNTSTMAWEGSTEGRPEDTMPLNLHPRQEQLLATAGVTLPPPPDEIIVTSDGHVAKHPRGWEVAETATGWEDDEWTAVVHEIRDDESQRESGGEGADADDHWQRGLDLFVDDFKVEHVSKHVGSRTIRCEILQTSEGLDSVSMPITFTHTGKVSKKLINIIEEVFAQGFRYGASWEQTNEQENGRNK